MHVIMIEMYIGKMRDAIRFANNVVRKGKMDEKDHKTHGRMEFYRPTGKQNSCSIATYMEFE